MRILAIDPGFDRCGIAILEGNPSTPTLLWSDCITPPKGSMPERLAHIKECIENALETHTPDAVALETLFFNVNKKTGIQVAQVRGVVIAIAGSVSLPLIECSPQVVKLAVTGYGNADKKAVMSMVPRLVSLSAKKRLDDEYDAIALGIASLAIGVKKS